VVVCLCHLLTQASTRLLSILQALFCQVPPEHVLTMHDVSNIWRVPLLMQSQNVHKVLCR